MDVFKGLGVRKEKREREYLFGSLLVMTTSLMAKDCIFSLAVPILASLYHGLNRIAYAAKPSHSQSFFLCHYLYRWLVQYFQTQYVLRPAPPSPLMVHYFGPLSKRNNIEDVRKLIHEGKVSELGCLMLAKNGLKGIVDNRKLDDARSNYLVALQYGFLPIRHHASFHVEPYNPHRFRR